MHLHTRNVNTAFHELVRLFHGANTYGGRFNTIFKNIPFAKKDSRNGPVMMIEEPVTITYSHPRERVLFNQARDANPFFHLYESLWMLAGRNDVAPLAYYNSQMSQYSDDGKTFNGAYGYRWRGNNNHYFVDDEDSNRGGYAQLDQLNLLIHHLKADPNSRRAVLQMWNVEDDLLKIGTPVEHGAGIEMDNQSKDVCCNLSVMFSIREQMENRSSFNNPLESSKYRYLDMTVINRSNDMVLGMLGANVVHFSFLQEYMAAHLGVEVGKYHQITNNLHVYTDKWEPEKWLADYDRPVNVGPKRKYCSGITTPLIKDPAVFEKELPIFVEHHSKQLKGISGGDPCYREPFLALTAEYMMHAFHCHKGRHYGPALKCCEMIQADDWRIACTTWIKKRMQMWENRKGAEYTQGNGEGV